MFIQLPVNVLVGISAEDAEKLMEVSAFDETQYGVTTAIYTVNTNHIVSAQPSLDDDLCILMLSTGDRLEVNLPYGEVHAKISKNIFLN